MSVWKKQFESVKKGFVACVLEVYQQYILRNHAFTAAIGEARYGKK